MDLELWPNCLNQPWPGLFWSGIAAGLNFYLLPMTLSLSWAILGINREQLNTRFFDQRIADVFCLSCNFGCLQSQKQVNERISFLSKFATWLYSNCDSVKKLVVKHSICQEIKSMDLVGICSLKVLKRHIWQLLNSISECVFSIYFEINWNWIHWH